MKNLLKFLIIILVFAKNIFAGQIFSSPTTNYTQIAQPKVIIEKTENLKEDLQPEQFKIEQEIALSDINNKFKNIYIGQGISYSVKFYKLKINNKDIYYAQKQDDENISKNILVFAGDTEDKLIDYCKSISKEKNNINNIEQEEKSGGNYNNSYNGKEEV